MSTSSNCFVFADLNWVAGDESFTPFRDNFPFLHSLKTSSKIFKDIFIQSMILLINPMQTDVDWRFQSKYGNSSSMQVSLLRKDNSFLTLFGPMLPSITPWFSGVFRGYRREHWRRHISKGYKMGTLITKGLNKNMENQVKLLSTKKKIP